MGEHSREVTAVLAEPADGARLVIYAEDGFREWEVIWRNDAAASEWYDGDARGQHWWRADDEDPMELHQYLKYAEVVFQLGPIVANFEDVSDDDDDEAGGSE
jgi:hypothetical protein